MASLATAKGFTFRQEFMQFANQQKNHPKVVFGNDFGNKAVVWLQTLVIPIDLAEEVRFELTKDFHPRQFSRLVHSTALPLFLLCDLL